MTHPCSGTAGAQKAKGRQHRGGQYYLIHHREGSSKNAFASLRGHIQSVGRKTGENKPREMRVAVTAAIAVDPHTLPAPWIPTDDAYGGEQCRASSLEKTMPTSDINSFLFELVLLKVCSV